MNVLHKKQVRCAKEGGYMLVEVLLAIVVGTMLMGGLMKMSKDANERTLAKNAADHMAVVASAASKYITANSATLQATATSSVAATITLAQLIAGGYLPATFSNSNPYGQTYTVYVLEPTAGTLRGVVLTSGGRTVTASDKAFGNKHIPFAASLLGAKGGYVPTGAVPGQSSAVIQGSYGGWTMPFAGTNIPNPGAGHLAANLDLVDAAAQHDQLYRVQVAGKPELNTMQTSIDMSDNSLAEAGSVKMTDHALGDYACDNTPSTEGRIFFDDTEGLYLCREGEFVKILDSMNSLMLKDNSIVTNGAMVTKPSCPSGTVPQIFVFPATYTADETGRYVKGIETYAENVSGTEWKAHLRVLTDQGWMNPGSSYSRLVVSTQCK